MKRNEFDIHDIGGVDPEDFDVLITDLDDDRLRSVVAEVVGIPYLHKVNESEAKEVVTTCQGFVYGIHHRTILPCIVGFGNKAHWVFFLVDSGSPLTYLSQQVNIPTCGLNALLLT